MKFPVLNSGNTERFTVEALQGGCNLRDSDHRTPDTQLAAAENLWWHNGALRTRPGFQVVAEEKIQTAGVEFSWKFCSEDTVRGENAGRRFLRRMYNIQEDMVTLVTGILTYDGRIAFEGGVTALPRDAEGLVMEYPYSATENVLIFVSDGSIYAQNSETCAWRLVNKEIYIPCVLNDGAGSQHVSASAAYKPTPNSEARNILTDRFCAMFSTKSTDACYYLPYTGLDNTKTVEVTLSDALGNEYSYTVPAGETYSDYDAENVRVSFDRTKALLRFEAKTAAEGRTLPEGLTNNLVVYASKAWTASENRRVATMGFSTWFGGSQAGHNSRQFLAGSPDAANRIYWSEQGQPLYVPETNYIAVGDINQAITAFGKQDSKLVIFKEREIYSLSGTSGTVSANRVDGQLAKNAGAETDYFPLSQLHGQIGCAAPKTVQLCGNRLCWADGVGGVYTLIGGTNGYTVRELSALVAPALRSHSPAAWETANAAVYNGHYLLQVEHTVYVLRIDEKAFNRYATVYDDSAAQNQLAWYVWTLPTDFSVEAMHGNGQAIAAVAHYVSGTYLEALPLRVQQGQPDSVREGRSWITTPITARLCTKAYDFGDSIARKRILRVHMELETDIAAKASFAYLFDGATAGETVMLQGLSGRFSLTPACARVRRFGVSMETVGEAAVDSIVMIYREA